MIKEITQINIDDYIREMKKSGRKSIRWIPKDWKIFAYFVWSATCDVFSGQNGYKIKNGDQFAGLKHYLTKKG